MEYTALSNITTVEEVKDFFHFIVFDLHLEFHPDDAFGDYKKPKTKEPLFTAEDCETYDRLMAECFAVCDAADEDIYDLGWEQLEKALTM